MLGDLDPAVLKSACGDQPSWICEQVLRSTDSEGWAKAADFLLAKPVHIALVVALAIGVNWIVRRAIRRFARTLGTRAAAVAGTEYQLRTEARVKTVSVVLRSVASTAIFGLAALTVLGELGIDLGPLIAGAGIVGVALGFGAQTLVRDVISGFFMLIEDQYGVGDDVDIGEVKGTVQAITLRTTRLRGADGTIWYVPNGEVKRVGNKSKATV